MATVTRKLTAGKFDVYGIGQVASVVADMPRHGLRLLAAARSLLERLHWLAEAGRLTGNLCRPRPVHAGAAWASDPTWSDAITHVRSPRRQGRPRSAIRAGRF